MVKDGNASNFPVSNMSDQGNADFQEHVRTWRGFTRLLTGSAVAVVVVLIVLALVLL